MSDAAHTSRPGGDESGGSGPSSLALVVLVVLVVLSPWPFGSVRPWTTQLITVLALGAALVSLAGGLARESTRVDVPLWPFLGFVALALVQLVPLPASIHSLLAPGSAAVWHPADTVASGVLGPGPFPISLDPATTTRAAALVGGLGLLAVLAAPALARPAPALTASVSVVLGGVLLAVYGIFARARFGALLYGSIPVPTIKPFGPFVSKNHFAGYVVLVVLVALGLAAGLADRHRSRGGREGATPATVAVVVGSVSMALAVLVSLSRGGVLSLLFGVTAFVVIRWSLFHRMDRSLVPPLVLGAIVAGLLAVALPREAQRRMQTLDQGSSFRLDTWRGALRMAAASPILGQGLGAFHDAFPRYKHGHEQIRVEHAENDYLETLGECGLSGLGFALAALVTLVAGGWRGLRGGGHPLVCGLGTGALAALLALAVHSAFDFNLRIPSNAALAALVGAMVASASGLREERTSRPLCGGLAVVVAVLLALVARVPPDSAKEARAEVSGAARADALEVRGLRLARAEEALVRTLRRRPAHAESWLLLAAVRADRGDAAGAGALARHAASLDPERRDLQAAAEKLGAGAAVP